MDYFAGLDISMDETHVCVLDREGMVVRESKAELTAQAVANELAKAPSCRRIVFDTGRMAPILFHGLSQLGLPVVCVEKARAREAAYRAANREARRAYITGHCASQKDATRLHARDATFVPEGPWARPSRPR